MKKKYLTSLHSYCQFRGYWCGPGPVHINYRYILLDRAEATVWNCIQFAAVSLNWGLCVLRTPNQLRKYWWKRLLLSVSRLLCVTRNGGLKSEQWIGNRVERKGLGLSYLKLLPRLVHLVSWQSVELHKYKIVRVSSATARSKFRGAGH